MRKIAFANQKGGVAKTTTAVNLGAFLAKRRKKVLVLDSDPQSNATTYLGVQPHNLETSLYDVLLRGESIGNSIISTYIKDLYLIPSNIDLSGAEIELVNTIGRESLLKDRLKAIKDSFDFVLIDCPPSLGLLTVNALTAADEVIIPVQTEYFALEGMGKLMKTIQVVQERLNPKLKISGIIPVMFDTRTNLSQEVLNMIREHFKDKVYKTKIRKNIKLAESPSHGKPILYYAPKSYGAQDYDALAREVLRQ